ncbi:hypothetical protein BT96DRAFT_416869 [Gymnopus androsaceus JB14]|uniref:RRM domain-containing protein n=1 Tax=Gymnopus androsaceus JB14 TaxID=1447944 RepID=A0A6A4GSY6_9AGAR|nr:hypothetical protein BT96DRAFT_416869 [Gymnopus androsaceus JB14]
MGKETLCDCHSCNVSFPPIISHIHGSPGKTLLSTPPRAAQGSPQVETVFLGRLPECEQEEIIQLCAGTGRIASTRLGQGHAFIEYYDPDDARYCIDKLHGMKFKGNEIIADFARRTSEHSPPIHFRCTPSGHWTTECVEQVTGTTVK